MDAHWTNSVNLGFSQSLSYLPKRCDAAGPIPGLFATQCLQFEHVCVRGVVMGKSFLLT